jgi:hypothetical protein
MIPGTMTPHVSEASDPSALGTAQALGDADAMLSATVLTIAAGAGLEEPFSAKRAAA